MTWVVWGLLLVVQNAAFTLVSRARNSSSLTYHAWAAVFSNGVWFVSQVILVDNIFRVLKDGDWWAAVQVGVFYTVCTMVGSLLMHWFAMRRLERRER